ncbi:hypothetical protein MUN84_21960 [Hymenobacter sp. 5516J-16]|uniref:hypothetical protein n=1 Tax=Hymenobacter sp. 5516J-16 TaxID=2932253 RepID=UPI001FD0DE99|nr:hypothetical protein [Hymenobacter sp. 5516J-16]UOQ77083.1 hypothetical protein MUN84_21960 [Hymenobacter sp. 5516J-16]
MPSTPPQYVYWQLLDRSGKLRRYEVLEVKQRAVLRIPLRLLRSGDAARVHYRGYTQTYLAP